MEISQIRNLIQQDQLDKAFHETNGIVSAPLLERIRTLTNRYEDWKRDQEANARGGFEEKNVIVNFLQRILTDEEARRR